MGINFFYNNPFLFDLERFILDYNGEAIGCGLGVKRPVKTSIYCAWYCECVIQELGRNTKMRGIFMKKFQCALWGAIFVFFVGGGFAMELGADYSEVSLNIDKINETEWDKAPSPTHKGMMIILFGKKLAFTDLVLLNPEKDIHKKVTYFLDENKKLESKNPHKAIRRLIDCWIYVSDPTFLSECSKNKGEAFSWKWAASNVFEEIKRLFSTIIFYDEKNKQGKYFSIALRFLVWMREFCQQNRKDKVFINKYGTQIASDLNSYFELVKLDCEKYINIMKEKDKAFTLKEERKKYENIHNKITKKVLRIIRKRQRSKSSPPGEAPTKKTNFFPSRL